MSRSVELEQLAGAVEAYAFAYLVTVDEEGRVHVLSVLPAFEPGRLVVDGVGRHTQANVIARGAATLVWPPSDPAEFSLIVDGAASVDGTTVTVSPASAIYHRPAVDADGGRAGSDCAPVA